jgi:hypothetical protein
MKDLYTKKWITENAIKICGRYEYGVLTLRALHYQLVGIGMTNDIQHYKRVVSSIIDARWNGEIAFEQFSDLDRVMVGNTSWEETNLDDKVSEAKTQIELWMTSYRKNRWENQPYYPEIFIEKKALQGVFDSICRRYDVALGACKGYPSLTFLHEASIRFKAAVSNGKKPIILYFGDFDPSGEDIPRSIEENFKNMGVKVEIRRIALMASQVEEWKLPHAPAKQTDVRTANWNGIGQVELDAVKPEKLRDMCSDAIQDIFDHDLFNQLEQIEDSEKIDFTIELKEFVNGIN